MSGNETLEEFVEEAPCGLLSSLPDGTITFANHTLLSKLGFERSEIIGVRSVSELLAMPSRIYFETHCAPLLRMQGVISEIAVELADRGGNVVPAYFSAREKRDDQGNCVLIRCAFFDAPDRREYERELLFARRLAEETLHAKTDFLAMFAHEVRNPLSAISMQLELLERKSPQDAERAPLKRLRSSTKKVLTLITNMLDFSRSEAGKATLAERPFLLNEVIHGVVQTQGALAEQKQLPIRTVIDPALAQPLVGDPVKLDQALTNLVGNAIKFTPAGSVTIGADVLRRTSDVVQVRFWVRDTGIGIPEDRRAAIFDEYVQASPGIQNEYGGTGLGLAITRQLVELQGGRLELESTPGRGSTFSFELSFRLARGDDASPAP